MKSIIAFYMQFTGKEFSTLHKVLSMIPGFIIFMVISPFVIFKIASFLSNYIPVTFPRTVELFIMAGLLFISMVLMSWALFELWTKGRGTPAPITPTNRLVTTGPYSWCRNPIELGTNIYFLVLGIFFDSLVTGILCMFFGLVLGIAYIKLIEEKEMLVRFGKPYDDYLHSVPFMSLPCLIKLSPEKNN
jgi:protein-S-isoprenylcysteine O-methyltransferase Ste14